MPGGRREALATAWVGPLTFLTHALAARPELVGVWSDDAVYFDLGASLAHGDGLRVATLPLGPEAAKYPVGWPLVLAGLFRLGVSPSADGGAHAVLLLNALLWAGAAQGMVSGVMPALGASLRTRVLVGLLLAVNVGTAQIAVTGMSEALFTVAMVAALALATRAPRGEPPARAAGIAVAVAVAGLARSIGSPLALLGVALAAAGRRWRVAAAVGAGWLVQAAVGAVARGTTTPLSDDALRVLHYYVSYDEHVRYYADRLAAGDVAGLLARVVHTVAFNAGTAPRALGTLLFPADLVGGEGASGIGTAAAGVALWGTAMLGAARLPHGRWLGALIGVYTAFYLGWTWPFASRFWLPLFPLLVAMAMATLATLGNVGRLLAVPITALALAGHVVWVGYDAARLVTGPDGAAPADDPRLRLLAANVGADDVLLGPQWVMWAARRLPTHAVELEALLPAEDRLGMLLGTLDPAASAPRLADELEVSLAALARITPGTRAWVVVEPGSGGAFERRMAPALSQLGARGRLTRAAEADHVLLLHVEPPAGDGAR